MTHPPAFLADSPWLDRLLDRVPAARVAVFGDLCLDAYWFLDDQPGERSIETGLEVQKVARQGYAPGGAGNVAANLAALGVGRVEVVGVVGPDLFGGELRRQLAARGLATGAVLDGPPGWQTLVYAKPHRGGLELPRLDFGANRPLGGEVLASLLHALERAADRCRVLIINQQVRHSWGGEVADRLNEFITRHPGHWIIADSRDYLPQLAGAALKLNLREAARLLGEPPDAAGPEDAGRLARELEARRGRPVFITRGEHGLVLAVRGELYDIPGVELPGVVDPVGAGDAALAALAAAFAVDADPLEAGAFANLAAAITTRKVRMTGTASPAELRALGPSPDYVHQPRLAAEPHRAVHLAGTGIELVTDRAPRGRFRHAIFDHDGTLSVLRQGWEAVMEPVMVQAILGERAATIDAATAARVRATVRALIERTTGLQTLAQMKELVGWVREFGFVPDSALLDEHGYKAIYQQAILRVVRVRREQLARGELAPEDCQIKGARRFLEALRAAGIRLYLASGTDEADAADEARALGWAELFTGGIFGSVGDLRLEAKRDLLARILRATGAAGDEIVVFGDGPVEMREARRRGAFAVGIASDEVRRYGLDLRKRARLIRAGADRVVPDFTQGGALLEHLGIPAGARPTPGGIEGCTPGGSGA